MGEARRKLLHLPKRQIDPNNLPSFHCPECGRDTFRHVFSFRKLSGLVSPTGQDKIVRLGPLLECAHCSRVSSEEDLVLVQPEQRRTVKQDPLPATGQTSD